MARFYALFFGMGSEGKLTLSWPPFKVEVPKFDKRAKSLLFFRSE